MAPYERLVAWEPCYQLVLKVYRATQRFPKSELYGLTSQTRRAAFSVCANIAEGCAKRGSRELRRFLDIALGSVSEVSFAIRLARNLEYLNAEEWRNLEDARNHAGVLLWKLYRSVANKEQ